MIAKIAYVIFVFWAVAAALLMSQLYLSMRPWRSPLSMRESLARCEAVHCFDNWPPGHMGPLGFNVPDDIDSDCGIPPGAKDRENQEKLCLTDPNYALSHH